MSGPPCCFGVVRLVLSIHDKHFTEFKGKQWKTKCSKKTKIEKVAILVGLLKWKETGMKLKPARGKRIAVRVSNKAPYPAIFSRAIEKWKVYHCKSAETKTTLQFSLTVLFK